MSPESSETLEAFRRLLEGASADPQASAPVTLTDALVGPERARELRRCAVPHDFDRCVLQIAAPWLGPDEAGRRFEEFAELSIIQCAAGGVALAIHERWRNALFAWWLREENRPEFQTISRGLADYFGRLSADGSDAETEAARRRHMYHLLGADRRAGMATFESLCRRARHQWRFTECGALIRLVHAYDSVLSPEEGATLAYHEGKLAADMREWPRAETIFRDVARSAATSALVKVNALVRLGHAIRQQGRIAEAVAPLQEALSLAASGPTEQLAWRALHELGETYRDAGELDLAETMLRRAIDAAKSDAQGVDMAGLFNSLGTVHLRRRDSDDASTAFRESLRQLEAAHDVFRPAQVQNNLALAYSEKRDWGQAEAAFAKSLELKQQAGDAPGLALALQNLSRAQAAQDKLDVAITSALHAAQIFESLNDGRWAGITKRSVGQYYQRLKDVGRARVALEEALALFEAAHDHSNVAAVRADLDALDKPVGLPWWAWILIVITSLAAFGLLLAGL